MRQYKQIIVWKMLLLLLKNTHFKYCIMLLFAAIFMLQNSLVVAHPGGLYCPPPTALFEMRVQSKKFSSTFSRDFDAINSIVSTWFACSSEECIWNRQLTWYTRQDTGLVGLCWDCVIASNYSCSAVS